MTWTKLGVEFFDECAEAGLSDAAVRTHTEALSYLFRVESSDMRVRRNLIPRFAGSTEWQTAVAELIESGFWRNEGTSVRVLHHGDVFRSSLAAQQKKRDRDKRAQQKARSISGVVSADVSAGISGDADRQTDLQTALMEHSDIDATTGEVLAWPAVAGLVRCPEQGCPNNLFGVEVGWGYCRDHRVESA